MEDTEENKNNNKSENNENEEDIDFESMGKQELEKHLVVAAKNGRIERVKQLLQRGASPDAKEYNRSLFYASENYNTPLQNAASEGFHELTRVLIENEADINAGDRFDVTALHMAAEGGHVRCVELLLEGGADCNIGTKYSKYGSYTAFPHPGGTTPLHLASVHNHLECVKALIWHGADYNAVDEYGRTSLYLAAAAAFEDCVHAHLNNAIWKDILSLPVKGTGAGPGQEIGNTPLHECVKHKLVTCIRALLKRGSDVNHLNAAGFSPLHLAVKAGEGFSMPVLRELVANGYNTDVNIPDSQGYTPLHYACFHENNMQERRPEVARLLIAYGANVDIKISGADRATLLTQELRSPFADLSILKYIVKTMVVLPSPDTVRMIGPSTVGLHMDLATRRRLMMADSQNHFEKVRWFKNECRTPRSLQHLCRYSVRKTITVKRIGQLRTLKIPNTLKDYLLFNDGDED
ncbi:uncharacterized protein LOC143073645 [Mytilus galloprovincialis]|uniref:SOCS box domain-containing protein n=1 Tax=Mytilus edulis TaxID=6550 RepID=A0A8S3TVK5_MYTED|nr:unnamed protein product [Mytilus edulis]